MIKTSICKRPATCKRDDPTPSPKSRWNYHLCHVLRKNPIHQNVSPISEEQMKLSLVPCPKQQSHPSECLPDEMHWGPLPHPYHCLWFQIRMEQVHCKSTSITRSRGSSVHKKFFRCLEQQYKCILGTDLHRQFCMLPHWDTGCRKS